MGHTPPGHPKIFTMEDTSEVTTHAVISYYHGNKYDGKWTVVFKHPISQAIREGAALFSKEGKINAFGTKLLLKSPTTTGSDEKVSKKRKKDEDDSIPCGTFLRPDIPTLLEKSRPSSFGRGDETVYNEDVRKGRELCPDMLDVSLSDGRFPRRELRQALFPNSSLKFKFSKLAIYEPGGHFHVHRDTVRSHDHQGTLLIEVKSTHTGGDLVLEHNGEEVRWSLEPIIDYDSVRYIAFFTDINHRVEPVLSGARLVLQYDIYVTPRKKADGEDDDDEEEDDEEEEEEEEEEDVNNGGFFGQTMSFPSAVISTSFITKLLESVASCITNELSISFPLFHLYTDAQLLPSRLKSSDQQIFSALLSHGYHVLLVPVEIIAESNYEGNYRESRYGGPTYKIRSLSTSPNGYLLQDGVTISKSHSPHSIMYVATGFEQLIQLDETSYIEYTGNEAAPAKFKYFQSVFVVSTQSAPLGKEV